MGPLSSATELLNGQKCFCQWPEVFLQIGDGWGGVGGAYSSANHYTDIITQPFILDSSFLLFLFVFFFFLFNEKKKVFVIILTLVSSSTLLCVTIVPPPPDPPSLGEKGKAKRVMELRSRNLHRSVKDCFQGTLQWPSQRKASCDRFELPKPHQWPYGPCTKRKKNFNIQANHWKELFFD